MLLREGLIGLLDRCGHEVVAAVGDAEALVAAVGKHSSSILTKPGLPSADGTHRRVPAVLACLRAWAVPWTGPPGRPCKVVWSPGRGRGHGRDGLFLTGSVMSPAGVPSCGPYSSYGRTGSCPREAGRLSTRRVAGRSGRKITHPSLKGESISIW